MSYRIDLNSPATLVPCSFVASTAAPGKWLSVNENGNTLVVLPDGSQRANDEPPGPNWDSPWTQAEKLSGFLVYRSANGQNPGVPRGYKMVGG